MVETVVELREVTKRYGAVTAVDGIDLEVADGEIFGLLGANGAGKTTAVECAQGLRRRDGGEIRVLGLDPQRHRDRLRRLIGSQLQESALPDRLRVDEAVALFADGAADGAAELERWGLADHRRTPFAKLSGGQKQRLFVALALQNSPRVVFLDELTQGLDPAARRETWGIIGDVRAAGTTVVLVTHYVDEADALCDRVAVMDRGRIVAIGAPAELTHRHSDRATVSFSLDGRPAPQLERLPGVASVTLRNDRVEVTGTTEAIAHVAAALVAWGPVPDDLRVRQSTLEDAVLALLGRAP